MDVREKLFTLFQDCNNPSWKWFPNNAEMLKLIEYLVANGVTVQEWISVKEPPKEKGTYIVCTDNGGVLLGHWYGTAWNAGGGAKKHLAYWMEKPQPPKGE